MIEPARLRELNDELGRDNFAPVLELFTDEIEAVLMRISHADGFQLEIDLHFLKGCALNLGMTEFARLCELGEFAARNGRAADADIGGVIEAYAQSKVELTALIDGEHRSGAA